MIYFSEDLGGENSPDFLSAPRQLPFVFSWKSQIKVALIWHHLEGHSGKQGMAAAIFPTAECPLISASSRHSLFSGSTRQKKMAAAYFLFHSLAFHSPHHCLWVPCVICKYCHSLGFLPVKSLRLGWVGVTLAYTHGNAGTRMLRHHAVHSLPLHPLQLLKSILNSESRLSGSSVLLAVSLTRRTKMVLAFNISGGEAVAS